MVKPGMENENEQCNCDCMIGQTCKVCRTDLIVLQGGYSSLGEFVREAVRGRAQHIQQASAMEGLGVFMGALAEDKETWKEILSGIDDPLYEEEDVS
jgi:hypothetical protein